MPQFAANLTLMYTELPFLQRFAAAAADGFTAVEYLFNAPAAGNDVAAMVAAWDAGERGTAALPGRGAEFRTGVLQALDYAVALACPRIHLMSGLAPAGVAQELLTQQCIDNLRWAAEAAAQGGCEVLIEPINQRDMPGYFLRTQAQAHALLDAVQAPNLKVLMDLYHCQITEGDVASKLRRYLPTGRIGHVQIAGVPERHEPDRGELHYPYLFEALDTLGYGGWVGCEYRPAAGTSAGLGWRPVRRSA